jgi:hypothetical protein
MQLTIEISLIHTLYNSLQHPLSLPSLLCLHQSLSGNGFQHRSFLSFCVHALIGRGLTPKYLNSGFVLLITSRQGQHRKHLFSSSIVAPRRCPTDRLENTSPQLVHWCVLGNCCVATGVVYGVITQQRVYMLQC